MCRDACCPDKIGELFDERAEDAPRHLICPSSLRH